MGTVISIFLQASGIALIVGALRWLYSAKGPSLPRTLGDTNFYDIKWQWRAVGMAGGVFFVALSILGWHELDFRQREASIPITIIFLMSGVWISTGSVITNQFGITKRGILRSRTSG